MVAIAWFVRNIRLLRGLPALLQLVRLESTVRLPQQVDVTTFSERVAWNSFEQTFPTGDAGRRRFELFRSELLEPIYKLVCLATLSAYALRLFTVWNSNQTLRSLVHLKFFNKNEPKWTVPFTAQNIPSFWISNCTIHSHAHFSVAQVG